jgi:predicted alpha/beta-hydrolase family hydrolase
VIPTPSGPARAHVTRPVAAYGVLVLGHGAGPSITTVDLVATRDTLVGLGWAVAVVEQPWLVAGGRVAARPALLDAAWVPVIEVLRAGGGALHGVPGPLLVGGRSAGARVACRTAVEVGAHGVLALSFPLHPPGRPGASRAAELLLPVDAGLFVAVVQGEKDPFGRPDELAAYLTGPRTRGYAVPGTHTIPARAAQAVAEAVTAIAAAVSLRPDGE